MKDRDGKEVGHFDVMTGRVECTDAPWSAVLSQLLPHYLDGEAAMIAQADLPSGTTRGIRKYVDSLLRHPRQRSVQPLIVGRHWKQYGKERLYVDRLEANGSRNPLGWFDLSQQYCSARGDAAGLVAFCGTRFKAVKA